MNRTTKILFAIGLTATSFATYAQNDITTEIELGAIITTGNTEEENIKYGLDVAWDTDSWLYRFTSDGFRSSKDGELTAQRVYHVLSADYELTDYSYIESRLAYEDDRFSGYENQADFTVSYGRTLLRNRDNMTLDASIGGGYRRSVVEEPPETFKEAIIRAEGNYEWDISETATFFQDLSVESGKETTIYRSKTGVETDIMENLSLRVAYSVKHQSEVPPDREKTDTETSITLVLSF